MSDNITLAWVVLTRQPFCQQPIETLDAFRLRWASINDRTSVKLIASDQPFTQTVDTLPSGLVDESVTFDYMPIVGMPFRVAYSSRRNIVWLQYMPAPESDQA